MYGGNPVRNSEFPIANSIGVEEKKAVIDVLDSGILSQFTGTWTENFYGGPKIKELEENWKSFFGVKHAVSMNSASSALNAAVGALGLNPEDEVIVSPFTMSASATSILIYHGRPVFCDIDEENFCLNPSKIEEKITKNTKGIMLTHIFGNVANMKDILAISEKYNLFIIEDTAQAPAATYDGLYAGTFGNIGVYSLNYHKTIHCGEGGIAITNDDDLAERMRLIRNHAEVVIEHMKRNDLVNMIGYNYRMTEIQAAIANEQLKKLESLTNPRIKYADQLSKRISKLKGLKPPITKPNVRHVYYTFAIKFSKEEVGISRDKFIEALNAEGIPACPGYVRPIYLEPLYQKRVTYGKNGGPLKTNLNGITYNIGDCPISERMHNSEIIMLYSIHANLTEKDIDDICEAFEKVYFHKEKII